MRKAKCEARQLPAASPRVETGPVQFGDDWPGAFIRGDNAMYYAMTLREILDDPEIAKHFRPIDQQAVLRGLAGVLESCILQ